MAPGTFFEGKIREGVEPGSSKEPQSSAGPSCRDGYSPIQQILGSPGASFKLPRVRAAAGNSGPSPKSGSGCSSQKYSPRYPAHCNVKTSVLPHCQGRSNAPAGLRFPGCPSHTQPLSLSHGESCFSCGWDACKGLIFFFSYTRQIPLLHRLVVQTEQDLLFPLPRRRSQGASSARPRARGHGDAHAAPPPLIPSATLEGNGW